MVLVYNITHITGTGPAPAPAAGPARVMGVGVLPGIGVVCGVTGINLNESSASPFKNLEASSGLTGINLPELAAPPLYIKVTKQTSKYVEDGCVWVVDMDLEKKWWLIFNQ